ncbi:MAG: tetratricopeptide repeat protein [Planctomycetota bacterium]
MARIPTLLLASFVVACGDEPASRTPAPSADREASAALVAKGEAALREADATGDTERLASAIETLERAVAADGASVLARQRLGLALLRADRTDEALPHLERATSLDPEIPEAQAVYGAALYALGDLEPAARAFRKAIDGGVQAPETLHTYAQCLEQLGETERAIEAYRRTLDVRPSYTASYLRLAQLYERMGDATSSEAALSQFYEWTSVETALRSARERARNAPNDVVPAVEVAGRELDVGAFDAALTWSRRALALDPVNFDAHYIAGIAARRLGALDEARAYLEGASQASPNDARPLLELASLSAAHGDRAAARETLERARARGASPFASGLVLRDLGDAEGAIAAFDEHVTLEPDHLDARLAKAGLLYERGRLADAAAVYEEVLALDPSHQGARSSLAFLREQLGGQGR